MNWMIQRVQKKMEIFFPRALEKIKDATNHRIRFAHYTSADNGLKILQSKQIWMRKSSMMNDFREIDYGIDLIQKAAYDGIFNQIGDALNSVFPDCFDHAVGWFDSNLHQMRTQTYLSCFSAHHKEEDDLGRLSMWRAYGGDSGIAIVFKGGVFLRETNNLGVYSTPVSYFNPNDFYSACEELLQNIQRETSFIQTLDATEVKGLIFNVLRAAGLGLKHIGFSEEQEWRVYHTPSIDGEGIILPGIETIRGIPQSIKKIPLEKALAPDFSISTALDRIIIGPTRFPLETYEVFVGAISELGVKDADKKVIVSEIPLRSI